ncbi:MAG: TRAP transporter large permease subunit [Syntrophales bacterium]|jgi:tripartite ATP-independent transporter DctM subunit|nr:TRAP transporter large permease subunit [Syntrophales bacterium]MCK9528477.1 TRAP transporter large permease subunit [Syntrophales bacterium]MDX9923014.1 TRAP transporter large permease subunit [Syntrophales bacterium]
MSPELVAIAMFAALVVFLFMGHPLAFVLGGVGTFFGIVFIGPQFFGIFMDRIYGTMDNFVLVAITLFILMGNFLALSGIADNLFASLRLLLGPVRGGVGLAVVVVCIIFAACTGIIGASVVTMGLLAGPILIRYGYSRELTTGVIAAGGSLGMLIPPSIMLIMMADQASLSAGKLLMCGVVPGVTLGVLYMIYIAVRCGINPEVGPPVPPEELALVPMTKRITDTLRYAVPPVILIVCVLGAIFFGVATPTEAAGVGAFAAFIMALAYRKLTWENFKETLYQTSRTTTMVIIIIVGATCFTGVFLGLGGGKALVNAILGLGLGKWGTYILIMAIYIMLGCFIDWIGIVMITFPIFLPLAQALGFDPLWFTAMLAINLQMSFLTPPFGYALFYLAGIGLDGVKLPHIYRGVLPFMAMQIVGIAVCTIFPNVVLWLPNLMMGG